MPINKMQQLMAITAEESGELTQVCMKIVRKYENIDDIEDKWHEHLVEELGDVYCMMELMIEHGVVSSEELYDRASIKREKLREWSDLVD